MPKTLVQRLRLTVTFLLAVLMSVASAQVQVTTYHNDNSRSGLNASETSLTLANVNSTSFGILFNLPVDGQVYAEPLYLSHLTIPGKGVHNVVYICTEHNSVYAYDADTSGSPLWHVNFGPSIPNGDTGTDDINPEIGITSTPVIAPVSPLNTVPLLYVVSKVKTTNSSNAPTYTQELHALDATTGLETKGSPVIIAGKVNGTGDDSQNGVITFDPLIHNNRAAMLLVPGATNKVSGTVYISYASHGDNGPYHGWVFEYDSISLQQIGIYNTTPNGKTDPSGYPLAAGGIWQGGAGPASDGTNVFFSTGNGAFNPQVQSYGDSVVRLLNRGTSILDYFTPADQLSLDDSDADLGSGGVMLLPRTVGSSRALDLLVQAGKEGTIYLINRANMGHFGTTDKIVQELPSVTGGVWGAPAYFNNTVYYGGSYSSLMAFPIRGGRFLLNGPSTTSQTQFLYPGPTPSVSANGVKDAIVWAIQTDAYSFGGPAVLHAYQATNLQNELYNSSLTNGRDQLDGAVKFSVPTIANGKVYVGTSDAVSVFGLGKWAATPTVGPASGSFQNSVTVTVTDTTPGATIYYTTDGTNPTIGSTVYRAPVTVTSSCAFKARAFASGYGASAVVENDYLINPVTGTGTGLLGNYYDNSQNPGGTPTASEIDPLINFNWNGNSPINGVAGSNWAGEWLGQIQALVSGTYTIYTNSDDGVQVFINGTQVINDFTYHAPTIDTGTITLQAGVKYSIDIKYFQGGGGSVLQLFWSTPGLPMQIVPTSQLYPAAAGVRH